MPVKDTDLQFNFDHWASVAKENPERFENMRAQLLEQVIQQSPEHIRQRLEGLQWRIDQVRNLSSTPLSACLRISKMMWDSVVGEHGLLTALETPEKIINPRTASDRNKVINLHKIVGSDKT